jgi:hypothetical protein
MSLVFNAVFRLEESPVFMRAVKHGKSQKISSKISSTPGGPAFVRVTEGRLSRDIVREKNGAAAVC